ncbi:MAG TPA: ferrous iron transporter B, partial [Lachnospiraceae bacterium]|nr:ferrous iron transporter B [Lachnospiraceae bacterium]
VLGFVPQMLVLFILLAILEYCGYLARVAFIMDRIFRKFGLSGKSFIPMLVGMGCGVPGIMASRTIENEKDRRMTIMTTTFIPCGAKVPFIAMIAGAIFNGSAIISTGAYFIGVITIICSGIILKKTKMFAGEPAPFVMELPNYRMPGAKNVAQLLWEKAKDFLQRAFTVIFMATIVIWFLQSFSLRLNLVTDSQDSILAMIAGWIAPIFRPVGFGDWRISTALITGFMAKESVVSTLTVLFGTTGKLLAVLTPVSAAALLVFCLLYTPCVAAITSVKRELGGKWAILVVVGQCAIAWGAAWIVYTIGGLL